MITLRDIDRARVLLVGLAMLLGACRDSSAPRPPITVSLTSSVTEGPTVAEAVPGSPTVECVVLLEATASGNGAASWNGGMLYFYEGTDRSKVADSVPIAPATLANYWKAGEIDAGEVQRFNLVLRAPFSFGVKLVARYRPTEGGRERTAETEAACGPVPPANSAPPVITALSVEPASGVFDPGQPIIVAYTARSDAGLLRTVIDLSGACGGGESVLESLQTTVTRFVPVVLPAHCRTDVPLVITVTTRDGLRVESSRQMSVSLTVSDRTPPTISPTFGSTTGSGASELTGDYSVGDVIVANFNARDNYELNALIWEALPSGQRDSVLIAGAMGTHVNILVRAEWGEGPIQLRLFARDEAGLVSNVYTSAPGAVRIVPRPPDEPADRS